VGSSAAFHGMLAVNPWVIRSAGFLTDISAAA